MGNDRRTQKVRLDVEEGKRGLCHSGDAVVRHKVLVKKKPEKSWIDQCRLT